jgi:hypothetical protein
MYALRLLKSLLANFSSHEISGMRPSTSEDEDRSTTGAFLEGPPAQTLVNVGGAMRPPTGTLTVVVIPKVPTVESEHCSTMDFPP